ncbi:unnamed protein product [Rotaria socialis]|uniref:Uncharacterized protein n=1 Tax=Rotaria socialis TaxID=392032 RepID=A0A818M9B2_9BILA|nr:unnamed protein product [Rotaria socialis]CAF3584991.1 unnamed protein product [Rotaria socialis]
MPFNRLRRWRAFLLCRFENHVEDHVYSTYNETFGSESVSSKDTHSHSSSSDGGISSDQQSWMSSQTNVYDQICYDSIHTNTDNNSPSKYNDPSPPYVPSYLSDDATEHYYDRLPTPASLITNESVPLKPNLTKQQSNTKKELHKELIYKQKMGQLLPKKPELLNVFKNRRDEEKKREDERTREQTKLEQILARQRQKIDESENVCSISSNESAYSNEFEFVYHRIRQRQKKNE